MRFSPRATRLQTTKALMRRMSPEAARLGSARSASQVPGTADAVSKLAARGIARASSAGVVARRQARHLRALDAGVGARVRAGRRRHQRAGAVGSTRRARVVAVLGVVRELAAVPATARSRSTIARSTATGPYTEFAAEWEAGLDQWDPDAWAARFAATGARYVVLRDQAHGRLLPVADRRRQSASPGLELPARRRRRVGRGRARRGDALRGLLLGRPRLDVRRPADRLGRRDARRDPARRLSRVRRRAGSRAHRPLPAERAVERHRVAGEGKHLWPLFEHYYEQVPDGVVNDRWMPWSPLLGGDALAARAARDRHGVPAARPNATRASSRRSRRTSTCAPPSTSCSTTCNANRGSACAAWTRASATTRRSRPEHFLEHDELLWMLTDIVGQGRQPAPQRRPARRRRTDPRRAAHAARVARRVGETARGRDQGDPAVGRSRDDDH